MWMMAKDGFVESHKFRRVVWQELVNGESDPERIAKKQHLVQRAVDKALDDLEEEGLVTSEEDGYELTDEGEAYEADRKKRERNT
jgi:Mn-dependent DtxR family transcriptional regulator